MCFYIHIYLKLFWHELDLNFFQLGIFPNVFCAMTLFFDISVSDIPIIKKVFHILESISVFPILTNLLTWESYLAFND